VVREQVWTRTKEIGKEGRHYYGGKKNQLNTAANEESTLLKGGKAKKYKQKIKTGQNKYKLKKRG